MNYVTTQTPSRLHFGLLGWGPRSQRQFGGVGLMVERPGLELTVTRASRWMSSGPIAERALEVAREVISQLAPDVPLGPFRIDVFRAMSSHSGLGSGTQLSLAVARSILMFAGIEDPAVERLASLTGRGRRSGIGIHGFVHGGLIVDAGRNAGGGLPTCVSHLDFPSNWAVLLVLPSSRPGVHGLREIEAFENLAEMPPSTTDRLCRLVLLGLVPAVIEKDLASFGGALEDVQNLVGSCFAAVQSGRFASSTSERLVAGMKAIGLRGVGQSSWGPCLYGFSDRGDDERDRMRQQLLEEFGLAYDRVFWTSASRQGAKVTVD